MRFITLLIKDKSPEFFNDTGELYDRILEEYTEDNDVVLGEFLANLYVIGLNLEELEALIKELRSEIDGE